MGLGRELGLVSRAKDNKIKIITSAYLLCGLFLGFEILKEALWFGHVVVVVVVGLL